MRTVRLAVLAAGAAIVLVAVRPASADCPPEDPACRLSPEQSVQVHDDPGWVRGTLDVLPEPGSLAVVPIPIVSLAASRPAAAPEIPRLDVPVRLQDPADVSCGVQALGMALAGLGGAAPTSDALLGFLQGNGMMYGFGTGVEELAFAAQAFGYRGSLPYHDGDLGLLRSELAAGNPVVVSLGVDGEGSPGHFVTVTGISADGQWIACNDPAFGETVMPVADFLSAWADQGNSGVVVAHSAPVTPEGPLDLFPWVALVAALMALVSATPLVTWRQGIGGKADSGVGKSTSKSSGSSKSSNSSKPSKASTPASSPSSSSKSSGASNSSSSKTSSKPAEPVKAAAPVVLEDIHAEMKDLKGTAGAGSASSASPSKPASAPPAAASKGLEKVKEVDLPPAGNGAKPAASLPPTTPGKVAASPLVDLADPRSDPLLAKGATTATAVAKPVANPVASAAGSVAARLEKVKDVEVLGTIVGAGASASTAGVDDPRDLKPKASAGSTAPTPTTPKPLTADERLRLKIEDVVVGKAVEDQKKLVAELTRAVTFKIAGPNSLSPVRPPWISSMDWNHMPLDDRQAVASWEVEMILSGMAPFVSQGAEKVDQTKGGFIDWVHEVVLPGCSDNPAQLPTAQELSWIYAKNSPGGALVDYLWVCSHNSSGGPVSWRIRSAPGLEMPSTAWAPYMGIVRWNGEVARDNDGLLWYSVTYLDGQGIAREGWMADHDTDAMTGLAPYRPSEGGWQFGDQDTPIPLDPLALTYGYGQGADGWAKYWAGGSAAQFLNMQALAAAIGLTGAFPSTHKNLCGQLAIFRALGISLEEGFRVFSQVGGGCEVLMNNGMTGSSQLAATFKALGLSDSTPEDMSKGNIGVTMLDRLKNGDAVIALVTSNRSGTPVARDTEGSDGHWIQVTGLREVTDVNGKTQTEVEYYNPARNNLEPLRMSLDEFAATYQGTIVTASRG